MSIFKRYSCELQVHEEFGASIPKELDSITNGLIHSAPSKKPADAAWDMEDVEQVAAAIHARRNPDTGEEEEDEDTQFGWAGFLNDDEGIIYEGRCIRGHLKDAARGISTLPNIGLKQFRSKLVNRMYIHRNEGDAIYLMRDGKRILKPDGTIKRFIQVMTRQGPRSTIKYVDYVLSPRMSFTMSILDDGVITRDHLEMLFEFGGMHGMGAERSQSWGKYELIHLMELEDTND